MSPENQSKLAAYRVKSSEGKLTAADHAEIIRILREDRGQAAVISAASKSRTKKPEKINDEDLLDELKGL